MKIIVSIFVLVLYLVTLSAQASSEVKKFPLELCFKIVKIKSKETVVLASYSSSGVIVGDQARVRGYVYEGLITRLWSKKRRPLRKSKKHTFRTNFSGSFRASRTYDAVISGSMKIYASAGAAGAAICICNADALKSERKRHVKKSGNEKDFAVQKVDKCSVMVDRLALPSPKKVQSSKKIKPDPSNTYPFRGTGGGSDRKGRDSIRP